MNDYEKLWASLQTAIQSAKSRGQKVTPAHMDEFVAAKSGGKIRSVADLQAGLQQKDIQPGIAEGMARAATRASTFGFSDEIAGAVDKLLGGDYTQARNANRAAEGSFHAAHPVLDTGTEIGAGVLPFLAAAPEAAATTFLGRLGQNAAIGAGVGAVSGAGAAPEIKDVPESAGLSGLFGAALGAGATVIGEAGSRLYRWGKALVAPQASAKAEALNAIATYVPEAKLSTLKDAPPETILADVNQNLMDVASSKSMDTREAVGNVTKGRVAAGSQRVADRLAPAQEKAGFTPLRPGATDQEARQALRPLSKRLYGPLEEKFPPGSVALNGTPVAEALADPGVGSAYQKFRVYGEDPGFKTLQSTLMEMKGRASDAFASRNRMVKGLDGPGWTDAADKLETAMEAQMPGYKAANAQYRQAKVVQGLAQTLLNKKPGSLEFEKALRESEPALQAAFPDPAELQKFLKSDEWENLFRQTANKVMGSATKPRQDMSAEVFGASENPKLPTSWHAIMNMFSPGAAHDARVAQELTPRLTTRVGPDLDRVLAEVDAYRQGMLRRSALSSRAMRAIASLQGTLGAHLFGQ